MHFNTWIEMATGQHVEYCRAGSVDQNLARQSDGIQLARTDDKASGKDTDRPTLKALQSLCVMAIP